jgi:hypothetical protein
MDVEKPFVFQTDSDIVRKVYQENPNYLIEYSEDCPNQEYCTIYFCSHNIYYPNTEEIFKKRIVEKNFYEWYGTRIKKSYKHIFIRDIFKQWYLRGINSEINTPAKLFDFLIKETNGYKVIIVGCSAGGYASVLYGSLLQAEKVLAFSPQFTIATLLDSSSENIDPLIFRLKDMPVAKYYDLNNFINPETDIYYFYPNKSKWDIEQFGHIRHFHNIHTITILTNHHGVPFPKACLPEILNYSKNRLNALTGNPHNFYMFSIHLVGFWKTLSRLVIQIYKSYKQRH